MLTKNILLSVVWSGMFIPDPKFSIPDPGSKVKKIPYYGSGSASQNLSIFKPKNCF